LYETFEAQWALPEDTKKLGVEPGHQFEWAWLLERWTGLTGRYDAHSAAETLFNAGSRGVDPVRNVAIDEIDNEFRPRRDTARLWPQTERLKAALILYGGAEKSSLSRYEREAVSAAESLWCYLDVPLKGLWRDKMLSDGSFVDEPAPASSFYRIAMSIDVLISAGNAGTSQYAP
jgi:mannose-6-phosphate isomerase